MSLIFAWSVVAAFVVVFFRSHWSFMRLAAIAFLAALVMLWFTVQYLL